MSGSVITAMLGIFALYILSIAVTWLVYGRNKLC